VALDLELTPELRRAGLLRDAVRLIQDGRKSNGLDVSDRIELWWKADGDLAVALREGASRLADEVLAVEVSEGHPIADLAPHVDDDLGLSFWLRVAGR
jgi:isoleucyl-tRNA synthetase